MSDFQLTREQLIAGSYDRNMAVNANAGSGKTSVLVGRFTDILLSSYKSDNIESGFHHGDIKPGEVVAITFTRKAAMEMVSKITKKIEEKIRQETNSGKLKFLRYIREKLTNARISTIHSFCSELLRSYPTEADVSPAFFEMPAPELLEIRQDAVQTILEEMLESNDEQTVQIVNNLFMSLNRKNTTDILAHLVANEELMLALRSFYSKTDDEILLQLDKYILSEFSNYILGIKQLFTSFVSFPSEQIAESKRGNFFEVSAELKTLNNKLSVDEFEITDILDLFPLIFETVYKIYTKNDTPRAEFVKNFQNFNDDLTTIFKLNFNKIKNFNEAIVNYNLEKSLRSIGRNLLYIAEQALELIRQEKSRIDGLDFDDLMILSGELLNNPVVSASVRRKIKFLLVDEFQDTNDLQYEIIKKIVPELITDDFESGVNLFIVGDEKQSIYGFRRADVRVFNKARTDISTKNEILRKAGFLPNSITNGKLKIEDVSESELNGNASLTSTFRLQPVIASFVNRLCSSLMKATALSNINYSNLVCAKNAGLVFENGDLTNETMIKDSPAGSVSMLLSKIEEKNGQENDDSDVVDADDEVSQSEADLLASYLNFIIESDEPLTVFEDGSYRKAEYRDIAVLSRTRKFDKLISALLKRKVPYILHSGSGFYDSQIIRDLISYLGFLTNPDDDLSLFGVLISPFFKISEDEILVILNSQKNKSLWEKVTDFAASGKSTFELKRAFDNLKHLKDLSGCLSISQNIVSYVQDTGWYSIAAGEADFAQQEANINKFLETAREFDSRGFHSIHDFVVHLNFINDSDTTESEAITISDKNAVNLLTIHASKGLEFPVVALFNTNSLPKRTKAFYTDPDFGITTKIPFKDGKNWVGVDSPSHFFAKSYAEIRENEEEKRILYVATTRAKDHLIISAALKPTKKGYGKTKGMFKMVTEGLELTDINDLMETENYVFEDNLSVLLNNEIKIAKIKYYLKIIKSVPEFEQMGLSEMSDISGVKLLDSELQAHMFNETFSATKILTFNNPDEYIKKYLLGFRDEWISSEKSIYFDDFVKDPETGDLPATERGTIIHFLLENSELWARKNVLPDTSELSSILKSYLDENNIYLSGDEEINKLMNEVMKVVSTKLFNDRFDAVNAGVKECELIIPVDEDILVAKIDLLLQAQDGNYEIWDWKSNQINDEKSRNDLVEKYRPQMLLYAYMVSLKYPEQRAVKARLLFTKLADSNVSDEAWTSEYIWSSEELVAYGLELKNQIIKMKTLDKLKKNN